MLMQLLDTLQLTFNLSTPSLLPLIVCSWVAAQRLRCMSVLGQWAGIHAKQFSHCHKNDTLDQDQIPYLATAQGLLVG